MTSLIDSLWQETVEFGGSPRLAGAVRAVLVMVAAVLVAKLLAKVASNLLARTSAQHQMLGRRVVSYSVLAVGAISALHELGFSIGALLGAAGIVTVALGFAAQTSASNLISGLFLLAERPFVVGDVVRIGGTTGEVLSIDWLSVKLRTFDNLYVRVPNESVVKSEVFNLTFFPIRRLELRLGVPYTSDLKRVRDLLLDAAHGHPLCLEEPKPSVFIDNLGASMIEMQLFVWSARENLFDAKNALNDAIKLALAREGVEMPPLTRFMAIEAAPPRGTHPDTPRTASRDLAKP
jgi:small-conductance mechanosensitive channel